MTDSPAPIEDRAATIKDTVLHIITTKQDEMFEAFDRLHRRNIHDDDVLAALRSLHEEDLLDAYAEWGDIDLREPDEKIPDTPVPDPGNAASYDALNKGPVMDQKMVVEQLNEAGVVAIRGGKLGIEWTK